MSTEKENRRIFQDAHGKKFHRNQNLGDGVVPSAMRFKLNSPKRPREKTDRRKVIPRVTNELRAAFDVRFPYPLTRKRKTRRSSGRVAVLDGIAC